MATKNAPRVMINLNGEEVLLTNAIMMDFAIKALRETDAPDAVITKAEQHLAQITKKTASTEKIISKAALENERLAHEVAKVMPEGEVVLTSWIMEHVHGIMTPQKCVKVMQVLIDKERVVKVPKVQGRYTGYKLVQCSKARATYQWLFFLYFSIDKVDKMWYTVAGAPQRRRNL